MPKRKHIFSGSVYEELAGYARAVIVGEQIYISGTVGVDFATGKLADGPAAQAKTAIATIENTLIDAGSGLQDIVRLRVYIPDPNHVLAISGILKERLGFTSPANTTICSPLAVEGACVEIEAEAIRGSGVAPPAANK